MVKKNKEKKDGEGDARQQTYPKLCPLAEEDCPFLAGKVFRQIFTLLNKIFTDFPAAPNAIPAKVWEFSGKENDCWENRPRLRERSWIFLL